MNTKNQYGIDMHAHRFAAWAASRGASVSGCRFKVEDGRSFLEGCGFAEHFSRPENLPEPTQMDKVHREWRGKVCSLANSNKLNFTHGVAAKLINLYLKSRFVCAGYHSDHRVKALHPPIDKALLDTLAGENFGGQGKAWSKISREGWSKLDSRKYEELISLMRASLRDRPLWEIEEHWQGHQ